MIQSSSGKYIVLAALLLAAWIVPIGYTGALSAARCFKASERVIRDMPIRFTEKRVKLSLEYMRRHYDPLARDIVIVPRIIVIHWTAIGTLRGSFEFLDREDLQPARADIRRGGGVNVSAHYLVDRDGAICRLMPDTWMARHVIGLNHCSIGIENVGGPEHPLTEKQLEANAWLVAVLREKYSTIERVIGHHEYLDLRNGPLWRALDPRYGACKKADPGGAFMKLIRKRLALCRMKAK